MDIPYFCKLFYSKFGLKAPNMCILARHCSELLWSCVTVLPHWNVTMVRDMTLHPLILNKYEADLSFYFQL